MLPIIGINDNDRYPAKSFSLIHELVHVLKRESSYCNDMTGSTSSFYEEIFCNAVAGEFLVPKDSISVIIRNMGLSFSKQDIESIAKKYSVSREVIIRRLLDLDYFSTNEYDTYSEIFHDEYDKEKEKQQIARKNGIDISIPRNMAREAFDRTSVSVSKVLYKGYCDDVF